MKKLLRDLQRYNESSRYPKGLFNINFYSNVFYRLSHFLYKIKLFPFAKIFWLINRVIFCIDIDIRAEIKGGLKIIHGLGLVIGGNTVIGDNFTVYQGVTIGGNSGETRLYNGIVLKQPHIGNNVVVHPHAAVIGPVVLNDNCEIGVLSIITKDVAANTVVIGNNKVLRTK